VVTSTLVMEGDGRVGEYAGGYTDWVRQRKAPEEPARARRGSSEGVAAPPPREAKTAKKRRLSFKESQELAALPERIDALEREREGVYGSLADPAVLRDGRAAGAASERLAALDAEIAAALARWEALELLSAES